MEAASLPLRANCIYLIQNRKTKRYLSSELTSIHPSDSKVTLKQLWVLIKKDHSEYQIMQMMSGDPLTWVEDVHHPLRTLKRRMTLTLNNTWSIKQAQVADGKVYFWIQPKSQQKRCLHSSSMNQQVKVSNIDPTFQICLWHFKEFNIKGQNFNGVTAIQSPSRKYAMALPANSTKEDSQIHLQEITTYGNQLWLIEPLSNSKQEKESSFIIRNFYSRLLITLAKSNFGWKIVQRCFNNLENQRWVFEMTHEQFFYIRSAAKEDVYLGFSFEKKGEKLMADSSERRKEWIIESSYSGLFLEGVAKLPQKKQSIEEKEKG